MARLRFVTDIEGTDAIELSDRAITVGRDTHNTICIADPGISKHHALLIREGHDYKLFDLHSANGTWVNDERITSGKLKHDDLVRFGHLELRYETATAKTTTAGVSISDHGAATPAKSRIAQSPVQLAGAGDSVRPSLKKLAEPSEQPVVGPRKLAAPLDQPAVAPKKLAGEPAVDTPRIRLKRE